MKIYLSAPHLSSEGYELDFLLKAFESNWIAPVGENIDNFEKEIAEYVGVRSALALNTGTAALHLALIALGVGKDDFVFCQTFTFVATVNPIIYQNAIPVFIDSDFETWCMCPLALEEALEKYKKLGKLPKAVIVAHIYGLAADLDRLIEICQKYDVPLIEDAAESLGTKYKGRQTGSFGKFAILSFNGNKIITTSSGGMLLSNDQKAIEKARFWASQSKDKARHYEHSELGFSYGMSNILAAIGRGQLKVLQQRIDKKKFIFQYYKKNICDLNKQNLQKFSFMPINNCSEPNFWLTCLVCQKDEKNRGEVNRINTLYQNNESNRGEVNRTNTLYQNNESNRGEVLRIITELEKINIEARHLWKPMHLQPYYKKFDYIGYGIAETLFNIGLCLPSDTKLLNNDLDRIIDVVVARPLP